MSRKAYSSHDIIAILKDAGFMLDRIKGSHHIFLHPQSKNELWSHTQKRFTFRRRTYYIETGGIRIIHNHYNETLP